VGNRKSRLGLNRELVATLRRTHPDWTLLRIATEVGLTKERVRQLLVKLGLPTRGVKNRS